MSTFLTSLLRATALAAAIGAASLGSAAVVRADAVSIADVLFLSELTQAGIVIDDPSAAIAAAGQICEAIADGYTYRSLFEVTTIETDLTADQVDVFITSSAAHYCPELVIDVG